MRGSLFCATEGAKVLSDAGAATFIKNIGALLMKPTASAKMRQISQEKNPSPADLGLSKRAKVTVEAGGSTFYWLNPNIRK